VGELFEVTVSALAGIPVYFLVPESIDDPDRVSGGNVYDRHVRDGLRLSGCDVRMVLIPADSGSMTARILSEVPDGGLILIDGLVAVRQAEALTAHSSRLRIVVLAHMVASLDRGTIAEAAEVAELVGLERAALGAAKRIIATSGWTRSELISRGFAELHDVVVAHPGTDPAAAAVASASGGRVLCVGVVAPHKGQDLLVRALAHLTDIDAWSCTFVGSLDEAPGFVDELTQLIRRSDLTHRATFAGVLAGQMLEGAYSRADLVVVPSRNESFGMVIAEALAHGIPVVAAHVGGTPEAMSGTAAGVLVPPEDPWALEVVLRQWWASPGRRTELKAAAMEARSTARPWSESIAVIESTLHDVALAGTAVSA
jgi:glycosyltransferase involved in cell wall biosynthesis